jgi:hypothetical protein
MTVTMAVSTFHEHDGVAGVGGKGACRNARHRECRRRRSCKCNGDKACFDKSFHWASPQPRIAAMSISSRALFLFQAISAIQPFKEAANPGTWQLPLFPEFSAEWELSLADVD